MGWNMSFSHGSTRTEARSTVPEIRRVASVARNPIHKQSISTNKEKKMSIGENIRRFRKEMKDENGLEGPLFWSFHMNTLI